MKIGFFAETQSIHNVRWLNYLKAEGINVFAITNEINPDLDVKQYKLKYGLPVFISSPESAFRYAISPRSIWHTKKILKKEKPDIIHAHYISSYGFIASMTGYKPLILTAWGSDVLINPNQYKILKWMTKKAIKKADLIICDGVHIKKKLQELGGENLETIYFGTDIAKFKPIDKNNSYLLSVISIRNLEPLYDVETLINAIPEVIKEYPGIGFVICGGGSQRKYLEELADNLEVRDYILFKGKTDDMAKHLQSSDIYVSTSQSDAGLAASTAEAMACELPVIITDFGDNIRWITNGVNGYLFPIGNHSILAKHIINLIENKELRQDMGKVNRAIIVKKVNQKTEMNKMIKLYEGIIR